MSSQADHGGHRERMRKRFKESGNFKGFSEHEILEMLLFYIVPRKNTNDIAHELIKKFGSLNSVLNASVEELSSVKDMGESSANSLLFFRELINYCSTVTDSRIDIRNISAALSFVNNCFRNEKHTRKNSCPISRPSLRRNRVLQTKPVRDLPLLIFVSLQKPFSTAALILLSLPTITLTHPTPPLRRTLLSPVRS